MPEHPTLARKVNKLSLGLTLGGVCARLDDIRQDASSVRITHSQERLKMGASLPRVLSVSKQHIHQYHGKLCSLVRSRQVDFFQNGEDLLAGNGWRELLQGCICSEVAERTQLAI